MRNFLYQASILSLAFLFVCCSSSTEDTSTETITEKATSVVETLTNVTAYQTTLKDTISVKTFNLWKKTWKDSSRHWLDTTSLEYFDMPLVDLSETLGEKGVANARFYMGLEVNGKGYLPKLMLVGADSTGKSMMNPKKGQYIYDLTKACPPFCND